jgi:glucokinase
MGHIRSMCPYTSRKTRAAASAEYLVGEGKGLRGVASVTLGTGIGCGIVLDGKIFHDALNTAGECCHQIVENEANFCNCGRRSCLEACAGGLAILRAATVKVANIHMLLHKSPPVVGVEDLYLLAQRAER